MNKTPVIIGAGLSGLLAAHAWPRAQVVESSDKPVENHKAVLRFRSEQVSALTGIPFRKVTVRKAIVYDGEFCSPTLMLANLYSRKVIGRLANDRSIWNLEPVERFIAPEDFYFQLVEAVGGRIRWGEKFEFKSSEPGAAPVVSTIPLPVVMHAQFGGEFSTPVVLHTPGVSFNYSGIKVQRYRIPDCDVYQTVYFPGDETQLYRATITGDLLIAESIGDKFDDAEFLEDIFGLHGITPIAETKQKYGKIAPIDEPSRRAMIRALSERNIYSLGRFATWRNILLDDLVHDIQQIKRFIDSDHYSRRLMKD